MVHKRQQISLNSPLISNGGSIELFTKDGISVFYTLDKLPLNRLGYRAHFFCIDNDYEYTPFCHDFGPPNLNFVYQFCNKLTARVDNARMKRIYLYSAKSKEKLSNGLVLVGCYLMINYPKLIPKFLKNISSLSLAQFRDALSAIEQIRTVSVEDCLRGFKLALNLNWFSLSSFDPISYVKHAQVEKGDINWIVPNKFIAFMGPLETSSVCEYYGFPLYTPEDHLAYFRSINVKSVIRLNEICYDKTKFTKNSINHFDLIFPDNSVPPVNIVEQFLEIVEREPGVIAVHCKQGLGRTGTLIACYLIKHYSFSAKQATAYIRLCRPGSVIAIQQLFLERIEESLKLSKTTNCKIVEKTITQNNNKRKVKKIKAIRKVTKVISHIPNKPQKRKRVKKLDDSPRKRRRLSNSPLLSRKCK